MRPDLTVSPSTQHHVLLVDSVWADILGEDATADGVDVVFLVLFVDA